MKLDHEIVNRKLIECGVAARALDHFRSQLHGRTVNNCRFSSMYDNDIGEWLVKVTHVNCRMFSVCNTYVHVRPAPQTMQTKPGLTAEQFAVVKEVSVPYVAPW